ncbi:alpha/beta hydrolase [Pseudoflavonifractor sp. 60]|nr:alpha/beta hydrolase [Pseudoflavonifractor sp. 60]
MKIFGIILLIIILLIGGVLLFLVHQLRKGAEGRAVNQAAMVKSDEELLGEHFYVPRQGLDPVDVNIYLPEDGENLPVVFNLHGGAFIAGDADTLDSQSLRLSQDWSAVIVTVNYKLAVDDIAIEYGTQEVVDTVKYFLEHAEEYRIDPNKAVLLGYSAGGYHAAMAAHTLERAGIDLAAQVLCYSFIGEVLDSFNALSQEQQANLPATLFVLADNDPISDGSLGYETALRGGGG